MLGDESLELMWPWETDFCVQMRVNCVVKLQTLLDTLALKQDREGMEGACGRAQTLTLTLEENLDKKTSLILAQAARWEEMWPSERWAEDQLASGVESFQVLHFFRKTWNSQATLYRIIKHLSLL